MHEGYPVRGMGDGGPSTMHAKYPPQTQSVPNTWTWASPGTSSYRTPYSVLRTEYRGDARRLFASETTNARERTQHSRNLVWKVDLIPRVPGTLTQRASSRTCLFYIHTLPDTLGSRPSTCLSHSQTLYDMCCGSTNVPKASTLQYGTSDTKHHERMRARPGTSILQPGG